MAKRWMSLVLGAVVLLLGLSPVGEAWPAPVAAPAATPPAHADSPAPQEGLSPTARKLLLLQSMKAASARRRPRPAGADATALPQDRFFPADEQEATPLHLPALDASLVAGEGGVLTMAPGLYEAQGGAFVIDSRFNGATLDLTGVQLRGQGGILLHLAGVQNLTLRGLDVRRAVDDGTPAVLLEGCGGVRLENMLLQGGGTGLRAVGSQNTTLHGLQLAGFTTGVEADPTCTLTLVQHSRFTGCGLALRDDSGATLQHNLVEQGGEGFLLQGVGGIVQYNTLRGLSGAAVASPQSQNLLLAKNELRGGARAVSLQNADNAVVLANEVPGGSLHFAAGRNLTVAGNSLLHPLLLEGVQTALLTDNCYRGTDGPAEGLVQADAACASLYGGNVAGSAEPPAAGADPALLPQADKERFVGMQRRSFVASNGKEVGVASWLKASLAENGEVIIPPGAYRLGPLALNGVEDAAIYAYGVLFEFEDFTRQSLTMNACRNISLRGLTMDMAQPAFGQGTVLACEPDGVRWQPDAGYLQDLTDLHAFAGALTTEGFRAGSNRPFKDLGFTSAENNDDGTFTLKGASDDGLQEGDKLIIRAKLAHVNYLRNCQDISYEDVNIWSGSGFAMMEWGGGGGTVLHRVAVTPGPAPLLPDGTRGAERLISTGDAIHSTQMRQGPRLSNCLLESMTDDGVNVNGESRVVDAYDPQSRTLSFTHSSRGRSVTFRKGDRLLLFGPEGRLLCDTRLEAEPETQGGTTMLTLPPDAVVDGLVPGHTLLGNASAGGAGFVVENCLVQNTRSRGVVVKTGTGTLRQNTLRSIGMNAVLVKPEILDGWGECGFSEDMLIAGNLIEESGYFSGFEAHSPILVSTDGAASADESMQAHQNVVIHGNVLRNRHTGYAVLINNVRGVTVQQNDFGTRAGTLNPLAPEADDNAAALRLSGVTGGVVSGNVYPPSAPAPVVETATVQALAGSDVGQSLHRYFIRTEATGAGRLEAGARSALPGEAVTVTARPNAGYRLLPGSLCANGVAIADGVFTMPEGDVVLTAVFRRAAVPVEKLRLNHPVLRMKPGGVQTLMGVVSPATATNTALRWRSSDPQVATVDDAGRVQARAYGRAWVTATGGNGQTVGCMVLVPEPKPPEHSWLQALLHPALKLPRHTISNPPADDSA